jgi:hypothetical protein
VSEWARKSAKCDGNKCSTFGVYLLKRRLKTLCVGFLMPTNPYQPPAAEVSAILCRSRRSTWRCVWWLSSMGGVIGLIVPVSWGAWIFYSFSSTPPAPGQAQCGMPIVAALYMMIFGGPLCCVILGVAGALVGAIWDVLIHFTRSVCPRKV